MNKNIQKKKIDTKIKLLTELIKRLADYNNIEGYSNQKKFKIFISYLKNDYKNNVNYIINITRGTNNPENIFNMRFTNDEEVYETLLDFSEMLMNNNYYSHTTFTKGENREFIKFNIHLVNDVIISLSIRNLEELKMFKMIESKYQRKEIIFNSNKDIDKTKDEIQEEKASKTIKLFKNIMDILNEYNGIENYENIKPYKLIISNSYDENNNCFNYTFSIVRGNINREIFLQLNTSIRNNNFMYDKIYELLISLKSDNMYMKDILQINGEEKYIIDMFNDISYEIKLSNSFDRLFFKGFMEATNHTLDPNNKTSLKKILKK